MDSPKTTSLPNPATGVSATAAAPSRLSEFFELTKPRLSFMSVISAVVGYLVAVPERNLPVFFSLLLGTTLAAGGAAAFNQWMERDYDARMARTRNRPLPRGAMEPHQAFLFALALSLLGLLVLWFGANPLASALAAFTIASYVLVYTPMKRWTPWSTEMGAIPGAVPPLLGWVAATNQFEFFGWYLFGILLFWQIPHFMAIAWNCRKDYQAGGFKMLTLFDENGHQSANRSILFAAALLVLTLIPVPLGETGFVYLLFGPLLSFAYLVYAIRFRTSANRNLAARKLFFSSIIYLPLFLLVLVVDRFF